MGGVRANEATPTYTAGKAEKKPTKWRLFHGKTSGDKSNKPATSTVAASGSGGGGGGERGKQVTFGKQTKPKEKKNKKTSKVG